jgi:hypothetical protein
MATTFGRWIVPGADLATRPLAIVGAAGVVLVALGLAVGVARESRLDGEAPEADGRATLASGALFVLVYIAFLTASSLSTAFSRPDIRLLSPVYVPIVALGAYGLGAVLRRLRTTPARATLAVLLLLFLIAQLTVSIGDAREGARDGIGFGHARYAGSEVADAAVELVNSSPPAVLYSTSPNALWAATRLQPLYFAPRDAGVRGLPVAGELDAFADDVACTPLDSYLVVHLLPDDRVIGLDELRTVVDLDRVAVAADGAIFRVTAEPTGGCHELDRRPTRPR